MTVWIFFGSGEPGAGTGAGASDETDAAIGAAGAAPTESDPSERIVTVWIFFGSWKPGAPAAATSGTDFAVGSGETTAGAGAGPNGATAADPGAPSEGALEFGEIGIVEMTRGAVFGGPWMSSGFSSRETSSSLGSALAMGVWFELAPLVIAVIGNDLVGPIAGFNDG